MMSISNEGMGYLLQAHRATSFFMVKIFDALGLSFEMVPKLKHFRSWSVDIKAVRSFAHTI